MLLENANFLTTNFVKKVTAKINRYIDLGYISLSKLDLFCNIKFMGISIL